MKKVKMIIALFTVTAFIFSCNPKTKPGTTPVEPPKVESGKKNILEVLTASEIASLTETINLNEAARGKPVKLSQVVTVSASTMDLTNNGGGSFSIDYGGATNLVYMFFRGGDSLSTISGNVYPNATLQYSVSLTTFNSTFTRTYYQSLVVTGSMERDANGVIGANWVFTYTDVEQ